MDLLNEFVANHAFSISLPCTVELGSSAFLDVKDQADSVGFVASYKYTLIKR
jgi:hypothetical protein